MSGRQVQKAETLRHAGKLPEAAAQMRYAADNTAYGTDMKSAFWQCTSGALVLIGASLAFGLGWRRRRALPA